MTPKVLPCTRLLLEGGVDLSDWKTDITLVGEGAFVSAAERTALDGMNRTLELRFAADLQAEGVLIDHGSDVAAQAYGLTLTSGAVEASAGGASLATLMLPGLEQAEEHDVILRWASEPNPASEGPEDTLRSCIHAYNVTANIHARVWFTHPVAPTSAVGTLSVGGLWLGGQLLEALAVPLVVRVSATFQTAAAMREHWLGPSPEPDVQGITRVEAPRPPVGIALEAEVAGPLYTLGARSLRSNSHRLVSRLCAGAVPEPTTQLIDLAKAYPPHWVADAGDGWSRCLAWVWRRRAPRQCDHLLVQLRAALWSTSPDPPAELQVRALASDRPPGWTAQLGETPAKVHSAELTLDVEGDAALEFEPLPLARHEDGETWLWLEFKVGAGGGDTRYAITAWSWTATRMSDGPDLVLALGS